MVALRLYARGDQRRYRMFVLEIAEAVFAGVQEGFPQIFRRKKNVHRQYPVEVEYLNLYFKDPIK